MDRREFIPRSGCKDRTLYRIDSRNLRLGVFKADTGGFLGLRTKFGGTYVFEEFHHENEEFGTVRPREALPEELPAGIPNVEGLGAHCGSCGEPCAFVRWPEGGEREVDVAGRTITVPGEWQHSGKSECPEVVATEKENRALLFLDEQVRGEDSVSRQKPRFRLIYVPRPEDLGKHHLTVRLEGSSEPLVSVDLTLQGRGTEISESIIKVGGT